MIPLYKAYLPPYEEIEVYIRKIYANQVVTNNGPLVKALESELQKIIGVKHLLLVGNATIGLQMAVRALELEDDAEIINSAFSFVAAPSAVVTSNCKNKFVDIHPQTYCLDIEKLEAKITSKTRAIIPTHVFNTISEVEQIESLAKKHSLKVIYDAAHSFGVKYKGNSIFNYGDIAVCSLHASKFFSMVEGGFIATNNDEIAEKLFEVRYFGMDRNSKDFNRVGFNGKNTEFHAAVGLANLPYIDAFRAKRKQLFEIYAELLSGYPIQWQQINKEVTTNYAYMPLKFENEATVLKIQEKLSEMEIASRRYFYPSLNENTFLGDISEMPESEHLSRRILSFPLNFELKEEEVTAICNGIIESL
jgi:dTDP-4-amino-4,6-dideoxygalactose transaminase